MDQSADWLSSLPVPIQVGLILFVTAWSVQDPQHLVELLQDVVRGIRKSTAVRNQIIVALHRLGQSYRQIAPYVGLDHTTVMRIVRETEPENLDALLPPGPSIPVTLPGWDWHTAAPDRIANFLRLYDNRPDPVQREELEAMMAQAIADLPKNAPGNPPDWHWHANRVFDVLLRGIEDRRKLRLLDVLEAVRAIMLSSEGRVEKMGDPPEDRKNRELWLGVFARLARDADTDDERTSILRQIPDSL